MFGRKNKEPRNSDGSMPLTGHLRELRNRVIICVVCLLVFFLLGLSFAPKLVKLLTDKHIEEFTAQGLDEKAARSKASKLANEDARFILPNACETKIVVTMNVRSLFNFFRHRCCNRAQWEIRAVANEMLRLCLEVAPHIFSHAGPSCVAEGKCPEGKMSCGKMKEVKEYFSAMKAK